MVTQNVNLTQTTKKIPSIVHVVQGDSGRQVVAKVTDQTISGTASMSFERPDGAVYTSTATINTTDNTMSVNLTSDMLNIAGNAKITFKVTTSNKTVSTFTLVAVIEPSAGFGQTPSTASNKIYVYVNGSAVEIAKQTDVTSLTSRVGANETNIIAIKNDLGQLGYSKNNVSDSQNKVITLITPSQKNEGKFWKIDGTLGTDVASYHAYQFNVTSGKDYFLTFVYGFLVTTVLWMDGDNIVKIETQPSVTDETTVNAIFTAPNGATSVRITGHRFYPICGLVTYETYSKNDGLFEIHPNYNWNKYITTSLQVSDYNGRKYAKIDVKGGEKYLIQSVNYWYAKAYIITDEYDNVLSYSEGDGISYVSKTVDIPNNAKYLYLNGYDFGGTETIDNKKIANFCHIYKYYRKEITNRILTNIKWCAIGDSLTDANTLKTNTCFMPNYVDFIAEKFGFTAINKGFGGTGYLKSNGISTFVERANTVTSDFDFVSVFGSFNDLWDDNYVLGSISDSADTRSVYGAIKKTIETLHSKRSDIRILLVTPTPWYNANDGHSDNPKNSLTRGYVNAIIEVGKWYGIPVCNLFDESGMHPWDSNYKAKWYLDGDGTHPTSEMHLNVITPIISEKIRQMFNVN